MSGKPPWAWWRVNWARSQRFSGPDAQSARAPRGGRDHGRPTRAAASKRVAPAPARSTLPTTWWPGTIGDRTSGRSPSTRWRSVRQTPHAPTRTRISSGPGSGTGRRSRRRGSCSIGAWAVSASTLTPGALRCVLPTLRARSFRARAGQQLPRAREVRRVYHPAPEGERVHAAPGVLLEGGDQLARLLERLLRRREDVVDDRDLVRVDRDLPGEAHGDRVLALAAEAREVGDVRVDGVERVHAGGGRCDRAHDARVARDIEIAPLGVAHALQAHRRPQVFDAPRDRDDARRRGRDLADVQEPLGRLGRDEREAGRAVRDPVALLEPLERLGDLASVGGVARLRYHVAVGAGDDRLREVRGPERAPDRVHPDPAFSGAELSSAEPVPDHGPRRDLPVGRHRVLEVEDQPVGGERERLRGHLLLAARPERERAPAPAHPGPRLRIIALRRATITTSPCWFFARCSKVTMPHCGRERDSRLSTTSVSA